VLINDKSQLKRNVEQIGFQLALKTSKSLSLSNRLRQTVPYCWTSDREGTVCKLVSMGQWSPGCWQNEDVGVLSCCWLVERIRSDTPDSGCHVHHEHHSATLSLQMKW